jgi:Carboxypeptidase regulatory-like domain
MYWLFTARMLRPYAGRALAKSAANTIHGIVSRERWSLRGRRSTSCRSPVTAAMKFVHFAILTVASATCVLAQTSQGPVIRTDTLSGVILDSTNAAVGGAEVIVTRGPDRAVFRTRAATDGSWAVVVGEGTGDYLVYIAAPGRIAQRRRVTFAANGLREQINFMLAPTAAAALAQVTSSCSGARNGRA